MNVWIVGRKRNQWQDLKNRFMYKLEDLKVERDEDKIEMKIQ